MPFLLAVADVLVRAVGLLALAAVPPLFSPEPPPPASLPLTAALAALVLVVLVAGALRFRARAQGKPAAAGAALLLLAVVAAIACAAIFRGPRAPLGRGLLYVALPLWAGLGLVAGQVAERLLNPELTQRRLYTALVVFAAGLGLVASQRSWLLSTEQMWWEALKKDGDNAVAAEAVVGKAMQARDYRAAQAALDKCLVSSPGTCACLARRAQIDIRTGAADAALKNARDAVAACPADVASRSALIAALAYKGDAVEAEQEARQALAAKEDPRYHHGLALAYDRLGKRAEALEEAKRAVAGGAGRDASLMLGALAINAGDLETAKKALEPIVAADKTDAEALYDLGIIADRQNQYNAAREKYLAALRADPSLANARYNVALLTLRHGVVEEAKHHARKFAEVAPGDPRNADLAKMIAAAPPPKK